LNKKIIYFIFASVALATIFLTYFLSRGFSTGYVKGTFYDQPSIKGNRIALSYDFLSDKKLVFIDIGLKDKVSNLNLAGRTIPLNLYRDGAYVPLMVELTPSGKVVGALRVCEPCGSFSFHIEESKYIVCDLCGTRWDVETLSGVSGGCVNYPPPRLGESLSGNLVEIDLSKLGLQLTG